ncbi:MULTISPECIES: hypothetical protein [unclassified Streptomyces]|uniref:hypothetical protein n=1 Tax=unclassified Streptomyces TaxID=2593676 RepID=UPI0006B1C93F|nr:MULTISPECIES: hypothetical protein [unclassified Streptomyces]KOY59596.1 hypothetical protein ADK59_02070 [Streptomyces sp. XY332]TDU77959.1 hypothetical protein EDD91_4728 [Streptomyces sp. KS 21]THA37130.1 hypothetical protein E6W17_22205 [Streptomyces sp. A1547]
MNTFTHAEMHLENHTTRTAELAAEAAARHLARSADATPALRNRVGEALVSAGIRLMQPAHLQARIVRHAA